MKDEKYAGVYFALSADERKSYGIPWLATAMSGKPCLMQGRVPKKIGKCRSSPSGNSGSRLIIVLDRIRLIGLS